MNRAKTCYYLFVFLTFTFSSVVTADDVSHQQKIQLLKSEIHTIKKELDKARRSQSETTKTVNRYDEDIAELSRQIRQAHKEHDEISAKLKKLEVDKTALSHKIDLGKQSVATLARTFYMLGESNMLKTLVSNEDPSVQARNQVYFEYLNKAYQQKLSQLDSNMAKLSVLQRELQSSEQRQQQVLKNLAQQKQNLTTKFEQQQAYLQQLEKQISGKQQRLSSLEEDQNELQKLIKALAEREQKIAKQKQVGTAFATKKQALPWPVSGNVTTRFGRTRSGSQLKWRGVLIETQFGAEVSAVAHGQVVFADWLSGYGYVLIIDHDDGYMSLYGHNRQLLKGVGDSVASGEIVAEAGSSGRSGSPALYFEIRYQGKPVDPAKWIIAKNSRR